VSSHHAIDIGIAVRVRFVRHDEADVERNRRVYMLHGMITPFQPLHHEDVLCVYGSYSRVHRSRSLPSKVLSVPKLIPGGHEKSGHTSQDYPKDNASPEAYNNCAKSFDGGESSQILCPLNRNHFETTRISSALYELPLGQTMQFLGRPESRPTNVVHGF